MNVLDLFSGIGGFSLGLERAGMKTIGFCENDPACRKVLNKHWPDVPVFSDITKLKNKRMVMNDHLTDSHVTIAHNNSIDVICGGYPCQGHSIAGKQKGLDDARSGLWRHYFRLIREIDPKYVLIENSPNLDGTGLKTVLKNLDEVFHYVEGNHFRASDFGLPHQRERIYLLAYSNKKFKKRNPPGSILQRAKIQKQLCRIPQRWPRRPDLPFPRTDRGGHGISQRMDRVGQIGNALIPDIPELIGREIIRWNGGVL